MNLLLKLLRINDVLASVIAISGNILLLYLVITVKNKANLRQFRLILFQNCILDLMLSVITLITEIQVVIVNRCCYLIVGSPLHVLGFAAGSFFINTYATCAMTSMNAITIPFYIRYLAICKNKVISLRRILAAYSILFTTFILTAIGFFWCYPPHPERYISYKPALATEFWLSEYPNGPTFVATEIENSSFLITYGFIFVISSISDVLIIYFSTTISRKLYSHISAYAGTKLLSRQIHKTLIIQAVGPILIGNLPVICLISMMFLRIENQSFTLCLSYFIGWIPVVNPIAAMMIITPFRERLKKLFLLKNPKFLIFINKISITNEVAVITH